MPVILAATLIAGVYIGKQMSGGDTGQDYIIYPKTDKVSKIIGYISREYVDPVDKTKIVEATIPKILEELDPHSQYIPAKDFQAVNEPLEGGFSGIGVQFNMLNDTLIVIKAIQNGPSEKVGILAGDRIIVVENDTVAGVKMPSDSIVKKLKGPRGTIVNVGVQRKDVKDLIYFDITRDQIPLYSVDVSYMINEEIGYVRINKFSRTTYEEFVVAITKLLGQGMQKLILDLRGNGGGIMSTAIRVADQFLDEDQLIVYTEGNAKEREEYRATKGGFCQGIDVIVMIDETSASASEIVAGAIQDNDRGLVIGRRSFGKGLVQDQTMMSDGSAIRLTIARYYTPTGRCIQKPYENGTDDYYHELSERFMNGELYERDSIHFVDSLKYTTPAGRTVYGGGGIMPDIFVPIDTSDVTDYLVAVRNRGLIYRFALEYSDEHRDRLAEMTSLDDMVKYLEQDKVLKRFTKFAAKNGVPVDARQIEISELIIETQLHAYIVRNIVDNDGFYPIIEKIDTPLQRAIEEISKG